MLLLLFSSHVYWWSSTLSFRSRRACHLTQTNRSGKSSEHHVFHVCTWCMAIFGVTSQGTKYRERLATNVKPERLRYATILTQDTWSLSLTTNISKFVYALHAYFLIGLRWPSRDNKRAEGVTGDNNVVQGIPSSFAPPPLLEKITLVCFLCVSHMYEILKMAFLILMPYLAEKYLHP